MTLRIDLSYIVPFAAFVASVESIFICSLLSAVSGPHCIDLCLRTNKSNASRAYVGSLLFVLIFSL